MSSTKDKNYRVKGWVGPVILGVTAIVVAFLGFLALSIGERRCEAQRPQQLVMPISEWETDPEKWGINYPREYESWKRTESSTSKTKFGGSFPRDYLEADPMLVVLFAGYGFSKDYRQARGHAHAAQDAWASERTGESSPATCWTCKSPDVPRLMHEMGTEAFYKAKFVDLKEDILHPISCRDCHDPKTMELTITRPALREAFERRGMDIEQATHQEMRSLVCAQCHVEYYFRDKYYLTFPWDKGLTVEAQIEYYDELNFSDWIHPVSKTPIIKSQHPDYELWSTGVHAYQGVSCSDCHMPYRTEGNVKYSDHQVQSPLLNIANSCTVCHRWSEDEIRERVESIQTKVSDAKLQTERALVKAHFDIAAAMQAGATDDELLTARQMLRHAQFRWDYVASSNGMGFHSPQECMRILGDATNGAQEVRLETTRILYSKGGAAPEYPDVSDRKKAFELMQKFINGSPPRLVPSSKAVQKA